MCTNSRGARLLRLLGVEPPVVRPSDSDSVSALCNSTNASSVISSFTKSEAGFLGMPFDSKSPRSWQGPALSSAAKVRAWMRGTVWTSPAHKNKVSKALRVKRRLVNQQSNKENKPPNNLDKLPTIVEAEEKSKNDKSLVNHPQNVSKTKEQLEDSKETARRKLDFESKDKIIPTDNKQESQQKEVEVTLNPLNAVHSDDERVAVLDTKENESKVSSNLQKPTLTDDEDNEPLSVLKTQLVPGEAEKSVIKKGKRVVKSKLKKTVTSAKVKKNKPKRKIELGTSKKKNKSQNLSNAEGTHKQSKNKKVKKTILKAPGKPVSATGKKGKGKPNVKNNSSKIVPVIASNSKESDDDEPLSILKENLDPQKKQVESSCKLPETAPGLNHKEIVADQKSHGNSKIPIRERPVSPKRSKLVKKNTGIEALPADRKGEQKEPQVHPGSCSRTNPSPVDRKSKQKQPQVNAISSRTNPPPVDGKLQPQNKTVKSVLKPPTKPQPSEMSKVSSNVLQRHILSESMDSNSSTINAPPVGGEKEQRKTPLQVSKKLKEPKPQEPIKVSSNKLQSDIKSKPMGSNSSSISAAPAGGEIKQKKTPLLVSKKLKEAKNPLTNKKVAPSETKKVDKTSSSEKVDCIFPVIYKETSIKPLPSSAQNKPEKPADNATPKPKKNVGFAVPSSTPIRKSMVPQNKASEQDVNNNSPTGALDLSSFGSPLDFSIRIDQEQSNHFDYASSLFDISAVDSTLDLSAKEKPIGKSPILSNLNKGTNNSIQNATADTNSSTTSHRSLRTRNCAKPVYLFTSDEDDEDTVGFEEGEDTEWRLHDLNTNGIRNIDIQNSDLSCNNSSDEEELVIDLTKKSIGTEMAKKACHN